MNSELHVIIIWQNARFCEKKITNDIEKSFAIRRKYFISWSENKVYENFSRFYAIKSRYAKGKMKHCGGGEFVMFIVEDLHPKYDFRQTTGGLVKININLFDKKELYRSWTGGGHKIHTTNSIVETNHNLAMFFGVTYDEYKDCLNVEPNNYILKQDLIGSNGWQNFDQLFKVLNCTLEYVILRNFEGFFDNIKFNEHLDIDLLVRDYTEAKLVLNSKLKYAYSKRVVNSVKISGELVDFDLRSLGDGYMCYDWENEILNTRYLEDNKYYRPNEKEYFYSLIYHAFVHKVKIANDYELRFKLLAHKLNINYNSEDKKSLKIILLKYMKKFEYEFEEPKDLSVFYNNIEFSQKISQKRVVVLKYRKLKSFIKRLFIC